MAGIFEREAGKRWPRSQQFRLSPKGAEAEATYREMIVAARSGSGRTSFEAARTAWSGPLALQPNDGLFLGELQSGPKTIEEMVQALESCGTTRVEVKLAIDRLNELGLVDALTAAPPTMR